MGLADGTSVAGDLNVAGLPLFTTLTGVLDVLLGLKLLTGWSHPAAKDILSTYTWFSLFLVNAVLNNAGSLASPNMATNDAFRVAAYALTISSPAWMDANVTKWIGYYTFGVFTSTLAFFGGNFATSSPLSLLFSHVKIAETLAGHIPLFNAHHLHIWTLLVLWAGWAKINGTSSANHEFVRWVLVLNRAVPLVATVLAFVGGPITLTAVQGLAWNVAAFGLVL